MIHYIVAVYVGRRSNRNVSSITKDPTHLTKIHLDRLAKLNLPMIKKATFVVSPSDSKERDSQVVSLVNNIGTLDNGIELNSFIAKNNNNHSYGSWNFGMKSTLDDGLDYFLIEDDYFPSIDEFYLPFVRMADDETAYVCQLYSRVKNTSHHAAISNGLMLHSAAKMHYEKFHECINISLPDRRVGDPGVYSQIYFLKNMEAIGFNVKDVSQFYCHPFLCRKNGILLYGNPIKPTLLEPIFYEEKLRSIYEKRALQ